MTTTLHEQLLSREINPQHGSRLFSMFPAEIRSRIFAYALADYPDPSQESQYPTTTCYTRPSYFAPRKSSIQLLLTCRAIYREAWHLPFILKEQAHWITQTDRAPPEYDTWYSSVRLGETVSQIAQQQGVDQVEIESLHAFAQMYKLEEGGLERLLQTPGLRPRRLTLTIRHTDWWFWENDDQLRFDGCWIEGVCQAMPSSIREFRIELESLERKKDQIDAIAGQMSQRWFFRRQDGEVLYADASGSTHEVSRWSGTSTWHDEQWVRDETEPGRLDYYISTVTFLPEHVLKRRGGEVSEEARQAAMADRCDHFRLNLTASGERLEASDDLNSNDYYSQAGSDESDDDL